MPTSLNLSGTSAQFVPSQLRHDSNGWYLTYYTYNPIFDGLERKRVRLNQLRKRCRSVMEFKLQVNDLMMTINYRSISRLCGSDKNGNLNLKRNAIAGTLHLLLYQ